MRYQKHDIESCVRAAKKMAEKTGKSYVFATALGYLVSHEPPPFRQKHLMVSVDAVKTVEPGI